ncbi:hypothetical protein [Jannaschia ovalis]|uniref:Tetratricopeptide repeat-like domain-containing protein n=1 Tax=Jannaschia ovalis TaxID=3038773 RepID=A0ABY8L9Z5_9RHOB|nr:hypothetical protein [Jannaschia sp. GRR-S6-38]WGH78172.1 hypothetical protein P8627_14215 [Jannaschia sp. GRR-S6-38]
MSNPESFIDEVTEEVRRDRLYALLRRWGWVAILAVILLVGGAAWTEWQRSQSEARAQAFGDALLAALTEPEPAARMEALAAIAPADAPQQAVLTLLTAAAELAGVETLDSPEAAAARARLVALAETPDLDSSYRQLALIKALLAGGTGEAAQDAILLEELAAPGAPYRPLALELQAIAALEAGDTATAITLLRLLTEDAEATEPLRRRARQLIVALGASPEPA